jgi:hypothetical protein
MTAYIVWLLVSVNSVYANAASGNYTVIDRFPAAADCEDVRRQLPKSFTAETRCIQARVARERG